MSVQYSVAVRNAMLEAWEATAGVSAKLRFYTGAQPANCAATEAGTELIEFALASDWSAAASGGVKSLSSTPIAGTAIAAGTAGHYRLYDSTGTTCHEQGSITATGSGGDLTLDNVVIASGQAVNLTGFSKTAANA